MFSKGMSKQFSDIKPSGIGAVLVVLLVAGILLFGHMLTEQEKKYKKKDILHKGKHLVSLIALHSVDDFKGDRRNFFLRTLMEYTSTEGLVYCFIYDRDGNPLVSLAPKDLKYAVPDAAQVKTAYGFTPASLNQGISGTEETVYEFAKPIFENGEMTASVWLGLKPSPVSIFSLERARFLSMIFLFVFGIILFFYYWGTLVLKPLKKLNQGLKNSCSPSDDMIVDLKGNEGIGSTVKALEHSLTRVQEKLTKIEEDNLSLASKLGVTTFEKKQIVTILDSINFGMIITDIHENIMHINSYMLRLLNKNRNEVIDLPLSEALDQDEVLSIISKIEGGGKTNTTDSFETTFDELAPGEIFSVSLKVLRDNEDGSIGKMITIKKITNEKLAEKTKEEFISHISHELKTPLTSIKSYSEMLMDGEIDDAEMKKEFYNTINHEADRLQDLIDNLLNMSRIEMGGLTINKGLVKTDWLAKDCISAIETPAQKKKITVEKVLPETYPSLVGDKELLKVAIINILNNAVKYTPENGKVTFKLADHNGVAIFDVTDTGFGISEEELPQIFERSYRSRDPNIRDQGGSGLGLAIASEIIHLHGGEISVESEPGEGTHFSISLPKEEYYIE